MTDFGLLMSCAIRKKHLQVLQFHGKTERSYEDKQLTSNMFATCILISFPVLLVTCSRRMCTGLFGSNELDSQPSLCAFLNLCVCVLCLKMHAPLLRAYPSAVGLIGVCFLIWAQQLFQKLKNLMRPYSVEFESPLELSAQGGSDQTKHTQPCEDTHAYTRHDSDIQYV